MKVNGEAIYATTASPFSKLSWGRCTKKVTEKGGTLYLHVFNWPSDGRLVVPGLHNKVTGVRLLATGAKVPARAEAGDVILTLPAKAPDAIASVIEMEFKGPLEVDRRLPGPRADGNILLAAEIADVHNSLRAHARLDGQGDATRVANWDNAETRVS